MQKKLLQILIALLSCFLFIGCRNSASSPENSGNQPPIAEGEAIQQEASALENTLQPPYSIVIKPEASGTSAAVNEYATIDYSHTEDGYVMIQFTAESSQKLKSQVVGPTTTYTYNLAQGEWTVFPLSDGNGTYTVKVFENISANRYAQVLAVDMEVFLADEFAPFIRPNQYVNYENATATVNTAAELTRGVDDVLEKVTLIYNYVVTGLSYDYKKAATVQSGYLPDLDAVLAAKKGICFDYASLMTGMLRSQGIPCKLVVGYAGTAYHAWIDVWSPDTGWVGSAIYFDGTAWQRMDPTFASGGNEAAAKEFIGNGENYTAKYLY